MKESRTDAWLLAGQLIVSACIVISLLFLVWTWVFAPDILPNTDPQLGKVYVGNGAAYKICDETTLLYRGGNGGISAIEDSEECTQ